MIEAYARDLEVRTLTAAICLKWLAKVLKAVAFNFPFKQTLLKKGD